jgi:hypothetical protein
LQPSLALEEGDGLALVEAQDDPLSLESAESAGTADASETASLTEAAQPLEAADPVPVDDPSDAGLDVAPDSPASP